MYLKKMEDGHMQRQNKIEDRGKEKKEEAQHIS